MIDPDAALRTARLALEPLTVAHAAEMHVVLADPALHQFIGGSPLSVAELTERYARLQRRRSSDRREVWGNWVLRLGDDGAGAVGRLIGTVQATMPAAGPVAGPAHVAWVVGAEFQGRGYASEAAWALVSRLHEDGWSVVADIHPDHIGSQRVAGAAGLQPTGEVVDGEVRWLLAAPHPLAIGPDLGAPAS